MFVEKESHQEQHIYCVSLVTIFLVSGMVLFSVWFAGVSDNCYHCMKRVPSDLSYLSWQGCADCLVSKCVLLFDFVF